MIFRALDDTRKYRSLVEPALEIDEEGHALHLSSLRSMAETHQRRRWLLGVWSGGELCLSLLRTQSGTLFCAGLQPLDPSAVRKAVREITALALPVVKLIALEPLAEQFSKEWQAKTGCVVSREAENMVMVTQRLPANPRWPTQGTLITAQGYHIPQVLQWLQSLQRETGEAVSHARCAEMAIAAVQKRRLYLWVDGQKPVAMAGQSHPTRRGVMVHSVYTPPQQRRRGYASALVYALTRQLLTHHIFCTLYAARANADAIRLYAKLGYVGRGVSVVYDFS